jgi:hypothetical protein
MAQKTTPPTSSSSQMWEGREGFVRAQVQRLLPALLEEAITAFLGRSQSARRAPVGMRNGYGKPRRLS